MFMSARDGAKHCRKLGWWHSNWQRARLLILFPFNKFQRDSASCNETLKPVLKTNWKPQMEQGTGQQSCKEAGTTPPLFAAGLPSCCRGEDMARILLERLTQDHILTVTACFWVSAVPLPVGRQQSFWLSGKAGQRHFSLSYYKGLLIKARSRQRLVRTLSAMVVWQKVKWWHGRHSSGSPRGPFPGAAGLCQLTPPRADLLGDYLENAAHISEMKTNLCFILNFPSLLRIKSVVLNTFNPFCELIFRYFRLPALLPPSVWQHCGCDPQNAGWRPTWQQGCR